MSDLKAMIDKEASEKVAAGVQLADAYFSVGYTARLDQDYSKAISALLKAIALRPDNALYYQALGIAYADSGENVKAVDSFRKCLALGCQGLSIELSEENPYFHLGWCLEDLGRLDEAEEMYGEGIRRVPSHYEGYHSLGRLLQSRLKFDQAMEVYSSGLTYCKNNNPKALGRVLQKNIQHNLERSRKGLGYEEYIPTPEEKRMDITLLCEGIS